MDFRGIRIGVKGITREISIRKLHICLLSDRIQVRLTEVAGNTNLNKQSMIVENFHEIVENSIGYKCTRVEDTKGYNSTNNKQIHYEYLFNNYVYL